MVKLHQDDVDRLTAALASDNPTFAPRMRDRFEVDVVKQSFFSRAQIWDVRSPVPMPSMRVHVAVLPDGSMLGLTKHIGHLARAAEADRPRGLDDPAEARAYMNLGDFWTTDKDRGELRISSFGDIPWRKDLSDADRRRIAELQAAHAIGPAELSATDRGHRLRVWIVADQNLIQKELEVTPAGILDRRERVAAAGIPVYPGNLWGLVQGRLVPIG